MTTPAARLVAAVAALAAGLLLGLVPATSSAVPPRAAKGSLSVTPAVVVPGQAVRFTGHLGTPGRRSVHVQWNMNRTGDIWIDVADTSHRTDGRGRFDFTLPAPSALALSIGLRVVSGGLATPAYQLKARPQELTVSLAGARANQPFYDVTPGASFTVVVDTTPAVRSALGTAPAFPGRVVTLQRRVGSGWQTVTTGVTDTAGQATFGVVAPASGGLVLRAREERWTKGRDEIGWYPSFPTYFSVKAAQTPDVSRPVSRAGAAPIDARKDPLRPTASQTWGWGGSIWDYDWSFGEDFDSKPYRGTWLGGRWLDTSDGTGRAVPFNGALTLQSKLAHTGAGDLGTTTATLHGSAQKFGRWEFRLQGHAWETGARPFRFLLELVPEGSLVVPCSPSSVVVAEAVMGSPGLSVGARSAAAGQMWSRRLSGLRLAETWFNMAVEVAPRHITWFRDGKPVATVKGRRAQPGVPLVPRLSLVGQQTEMNGAEIDSDWQRAFSLDRGTQVTSGRPLVKAPYSAAC